MLLWKEKISNRLSFQSSILPQTVQEDDSSRRRRRHHHRHLMTTTSTNTMTSTSYNNNTMAFNPNAVTCTSFLMGGAYYPGKDKKVLHMRRKTLWYRIGWSSPIRRGLSLLLLLYVLIYVIWIPLISFLMHYGHLLSKNSNHPLNAKNTNVNMNTNVNVNTNVNTNSNSNANNTNTQSHHEIHLDSKITNLKASSHKRIRYNIIQQQLVPDWIPKRHYEEDPNDHHHPLKQEEEYKEQDAQTLTFPSKQNDMDIPSSNTHPSVPLRTLNNRYMHDTNSKCYTRNETSNNNNMMKNGITLVLQGTLDRLPLIRLTCQRWNQAPIVMVVYMKHDEDHDDDNDNDDDLLSWSDLVWKYTSTCPHLTLIPYTPLSQIEEQDPDPDPEQDTNNNNNNNSNSNNSKSQTTSWYPINKLRNIALDHVQTTHVLVLDVDFIPSEGLDEAIQNVLQQGTTNDNDAIVVPAFQRKAREPPCSNLEACLQYIQKDFIPTSTMELKTCIRSKNCDIFQKDVKPQGHMDTRYSRWIKEIDATSITTTKSSMHQIECFSTLDYEPYVVIPWCPSVESNPSNDNNRTLTPRSPYYDERFQGYGKNKIQMTSHLRYLGYKFWIMPSTGFITHFPHSTSKTKKDWIHNKENLHQRMDQLYSHYLNELEHTYQNEFEIMTPLCSDLVQ